MAKEIEVVYEEGVFKPLENLADSIFISKDKTMKK
jgi:hypothetical protein